MKVIKMLFVAQLLGISAFAQQVEWVSSAGYVGVANSYFGAVDIVKDPSGNVYTLDFANGQQICQGTMIDTYNGTTTFVYKFDPEGALLAVHRIGSTQAGGSFTPFSIEADELGNIFVLGQPNGVNQITMNDQTVSVSANTNQIFKIDPNGLMLWHYNTGFGSNGESCMLEYSNGLLYFQSGDLGIACLNEAGLLEHTLVANSYSSPTSSTGPMFKGSGVFQNGDILMAAYSRGDLIIGEDTLLLNETTPFLSAPYLLMRCSEELGVVWATYVRNGRDPDQNFIPVTIDNEDNIYFSAQVNIELEAGDDIISNPNNVSLGIGSIVKLDPNGEALWAKEISSNTSVQAWALENAADGSRIVLGGGMTGTASFGDIQVTGASGSLPYLAFMDSEGIIDNAFTYSSNAFQSDSRCLLHDGEGAYYTGGKLFAWQDPVFNCVEADPLNGLYVAKINETFATVPNPVIELIDNGSEGITLNASPDFTGEIQWLLNEEPIPNANSSTFIPEESGFYTVSYTYVNGCVGTETSAPVQVIITSVDDTEKNSLRIAPNPSNGQLTILGDASNGEPLNILIYDLSGSMVRSIGMHQPGSLLHLEDLPSGYYTMLIQGDVNQRLRLILQ